MKNLALLLIFLTFAVLASAQVVLPDTSIEQSVQSPNPKLIELQREQTSLRHKLELLIRDTVLMQVRYSELQHKNIALQKELDRYKNGVFFGLGFGFNYFLNSPPNYYVASDSSLGKYGNESGISFILSGFIAYKIKEKHSLIFNVPLGDLTNRDEFKIGVFNQKMAGGIGYGRNLGDVSIICIVNISPYDQIEYEVLKDEQFEMAKYTPIDPADYPSSTHYSPSFTVGFSYNFIPGGTGNNPFSRF